MMEDKHFIYWELLKRVEINAQPLKIPAPLWG